MKTWLIGLYHIRTNKRKFEKFIFHHLQFSHKTINRQRQTSGWLWAKCLKSKKVFFQPWKWKKKDKLPPVPVCADHHVLPTKHYTDLAGILTFSSRKLMSSVCRDNKTDKRMAVEVHDKAWSKSFQGWEHICCVLISISHCE